MRLRTGIGAIGNGVIGGTVTVDIQATGQRVAIGIADGPIEGHRAARGGRVGRSAEVAIESRQCIGRRNGDRHSAVCLSAVSVTHAQRSGITARGRVSMCLRCGIGAVGNGVIGGAVTIDVQGTGQRVTICITDIPTEGHRRVDTRGIRRRLEAVDHRWLLIVAASVITATTATAGCQRAGHEKNSYLE